MPKILRKQDGVPGAEYIGRWNNVSKINVFDITDANGLNAMIGIAKHRNSDGTVLYRGQCKLYEHLVPSIMHDMITFSKNLIALQDSLEKMYEDKSLTEYCNWGNTVSGWKLYIKTTYEAALQHYGAKTRSVDFVDNHWTALWFALNEYKSGMYRKRKITEVPAVEERWITYADPKRKDDVNQYGYIFLYFADTSVPEVNGLYLGKDAYTVDLRKALPPTFLRPVSQHGWVVRKRDVRMDMLDVLEGKSNTSDQHIFDKDVVGILRIRIDLIDSMLGDGILLSQENFFPGTEYDKGYKKLVDLQGSILPLNMLETYHTKA